MKLTQTIKEMRQAAKAKGHELGKFRPVYSDQGFGHLFSEAQCLQCWQLFFVNKNGTIDKVRFECNKSRV